MAVSGSPAIIVQSLAGSCQQKALCRVLWELIVDLCTGGKDVLIQELNAKDAYVAAPGSAAITVQSLAGTCVLTAGGPAPNRAPRSSVPQGIKAHLSGRVGHVMLTSHGGPIKLYLPHSTGESSHQNVLVNAERELACQMANEHQH